MSLVGTRPPTVDEWELYEPHHRARMSFRPGLTGMWQVSGRSNITDFEEVVKLDTQYIIWSSIVLALGNIKEEVVERPKALGDIRGVTYIYGMFYRFGLIDVPDEVKEKMGRPKDRKK